MPSFDVVNEINTQEVENAVNITRKVIGTRYDFRGSDTTVEFDKKTPSLTLETSDTMKLQALDGEIVANLVKRGVDVRALDRKDPEAASKGRVRQHITLKKGIDRDMAKDITKRIKDSKLKVQASIQGDTVRVSGKKRDDLQEAIAFVKKTITDFPLQYQNFRD